MTPTTEDRRRAARVDAVCAQAVDLARAAAVEEGGAAGVGPHEGVDAEAERSATHYFTALATGYRGWRWAVTLTRAPRLKPTVSEVVLLPGSDALLAPPWVPWTERLRPGDLGPGDLLPTPPDDPRLAPGYTGEDEPASMAAEPAGLRIELGLGRERVLSLEGRAQASDRWHDGDAGPRGGNAQAAPAQCTTCGFLVLLAGALGQAFGACANEYSPFDGRVVAHDAGCGAHSSVVAEPLSTVPPTVFDTVAHDVADVDAAPTDPAAADQGLAVQEPAPSDPALPDTAAEPDAVDPAPALADPASVAEPAAPDPAESGGEEFGHA